MRIDYHEHPEITRPMRALSRAASEGSLEPALLELVKVRASQLNRCAHCLEMHTKDARANGESDDRLHLVAAWREAPVFSERERAAFLWCEELTLLADREVADEVYDAVRQVFSEDELCQLTLAVVVINSWNRFAVGFRAPVGDYVPRAPAAPMEP
jgi:alkylhydroperoxidase AhpD family core domain